MDNSQPSSGCAQPAPAAMQTVEGVTAQRKEACLGQS